jgi:hypothetical protein
MASVVVMRKSAIFFDIVLIRTAPVARFLQPLH